MQSTVLWYLSFLFSLKVVRVNAFRIEDSQWEEKIPHGMSISVLRPGDIDDLMVLHDKECTTWNFLFTKENVEKRLRERHRCYIARQGNNVVGFIWFGLDKVYSPDLCAVFRVGSDSAVSYNGYVKASFRGRGILPLLRRTAFRDFYGEGFRHCYGYSRTGNEAVKRSARKHGVMKGGKIFYGHIMGYNFLLPLVDRQSGVHVSYCGDHWLTWKSLAKKIVSSRRCL